LQIVSRDKLLSITLDPELPELPTPTTPKATQPTTPQSGGFLQRFGSSIKQTFFGLSFDVKKQLKEVKNFSLTSTLTEYESILENFDESVKEDSPERSTELDGLRSFIYSRDKSMVLLPIVAHENVLPGFRDMVEKWIREPDWDYGGIDEYEKYLQAVEEACSTRSRTILSISSSRILKSSYSSFDHLLTAALTILTLSKGIDTADLVTKLKRETQYARSPVLPSLLRFCEKAAPLLKVSTRSKQLLDIALLGVKSVEDVETVLSRIDNLATKSSMRVSADLVSEFDDEVDASFGPLPLQLDSNHVENIRAAIKNSNTSRSIDIESVVIKFTKVLSKFEGAPHLIRDIVDHFLPYHSTYGWARLAEARLYVDNTHPLSNELISAFKHRISSDLNYYTPTPRFVNEQLLREDALLYECVEVRDVLKCSEEATSSTKKVSDREAAS
jgi:hypothetical protein